MRIRLLALLLLASLSGPAATQVPMQGAFTATKSCPALASIRRNANPGGVKLEPGASYPLLGKNGEAATHYWIEVAGVETVRRWVETGCGTPVADVVPKPRPASAGKPPFHILAVSWQPAFCEGHAGKIECTTQTPERHDASHFALHGLWPQPRDNIFCRVSAADRAAAERGDWELLPATELADTTRARLEQVMPGTQSLLDRHEWTKHGSCYAGNSAETYYADSLRLMEALNASAARELFASRIGATVHTDEIRAAFDRAFGAGAGERVRVACANDGGRRLIVELTIGLKGDIVAGTPMADLIVASVPTSAGCDRGIVDKAGLQ